MSKLSSIIPRDKILIPILTPEGEDVGVVMEFDPMDGRTDTGYTHILQRGSRQKNSTVDEAMRYVFKHKFAAVTGLDGEDVRGYGCTEEQVRLFESDQKRFFLEVPDMWRVVRVATNAYIDRVMPEPGDSKSSG